MYMERDDGNELFYSLCSSSVLQELDREGMLPLSERLPPFIHHNFIFTGDFFEVASVLFGNPLAQMLLLIEVHVNARWLSCHGDVALDVAVKPNLAHKLIDERLFLRLALLLLLAVS